VLASRGTIRVWQADLLYSAIEIDDVLRREFSDSSDSPIEARFIDCNIGEALPAPTMQKDRRRMHGGQSASTRLQLLVHLV
jgi:hypothetical protein